ncbi:bifunctional proline dehydrogenase/L-glutamate gamma-semialdehyde dehydrogenase PutA [Methylosinus sp. LW4]|uniref:bifunctional proline dehydrogenase/L-glutamate gamma-semialdehyde dehydrogenase PutA n=1 Tax=Methylosinus sp. LW4 TaxID=136993 RepID=UPI0003701062|nr:bifunctional proline dehydrogenase/L-glutamate gamma-semialdehyde dehydrogenase PutA [Methylosinus sp. LW4]
MPEPEPFHAPWFPADEEIAAKFLTQPRDAEQNARIEQLARRLLAAMRAPKSMASVETLLQEYSLSTREGLALMALAESLLRVPDDSTLDLLIADKLAAGAFDRHSPASDALLVQATAFALGLSTKIFAADETPRGLVAQAARRLGAPALRGAARQAMKLMGGHFVLGQTIDEALARAADDERWRYSFDMLGEGARSAADAERYFAAYAAAIEAIGAKAGACALPQRPGVSVKLSALHPRFEPLSRARVLRELTPRLLELARLARAHDLVFTVDAEEADRLELSLDVIDAVVADSSLAGWNGFGLAIQAYQKRAAAVIGHMEALAKAHDRRFMVRLVKGAYWDTEIKRAQERGLADYPVFTRKAMTDLNYVACADLLLAAPRIFPQFATHNAATVATIVERAGDPTQYEFQRLHGMGEDLFGALLAEKHDASCRVYAPVGPHRDLLAYLVRRLIENGANSSFVARAADCATPESELLAFPGEVIGDASCARHSRLPFPADLYRPLRANSKGVEFGDRDALAELLAERDAAPAILHAAPSSGRSARAPRELRSPIDDSSLIGSVVEADVETARAAMITAARAFPAWEATTVEARAAILERAANLVEARRGALIALLQRESGKTLDDALAEIREAADLIRYYAEQARRLCAEESLPGPTGEDNRLRRRGRGVFVCISPWNFPLAIFLGQVAAALAAGNSAIAKPAEQTPLIAREAVALLHEAGVPHGALHYIPGDGAIGAALVADPHVAGVVFTGSSGTAQSINRTLAASNGPIVPLIAETGGVNAMIVDSTALLEQVVDDVLASAFRSAGQRCSALRLLCLQEDIAEDALAMLIGATKELRVGDPRDPSTHIGPVIDSTARARLCDYLAQRRAQGRVLYAGEAPKSGSFVAPHIIRLDRAGDLRDEIFGPVLHIATWRAEDEKDLSTLIDEISANGFGLTMGLHTRIEARMRMFAEATPAGNLYVNRNMIGAVVGSQPFGGSRMSGTGPKAGGPDYLRRFLREETVTINTASFGGDARLLAMKE